MKVNKIKRQNKQSKALIVSKLSGGKEEFGSDEWKG